MEQIEKEKEQMEKEKEQIEHRGDIAKRTLLEGKFPDNKEIEEGQDDQSMDKQS